MVLCWSPYWNRATPVTAPMTTRACSARTGGVTHLPPPLGFGEGAGNQFESRVLAVQHARRQLGMAAHLQGDGTQQPGDRIVLVVGLRTGAKNLAQLLPEAAPLPYRP